MLSELALEPKLTTFCLLFFIFSSNSNWSFHFLTICLRSPLSLLNFTLNFFGTFNSISCGYWLSIVEIIQHCSIMEIIQHCSIVEIIQHCSIVEIIQHCSIVEIIQHCSIVEINAYWCRRKSLLSDLLHSYDYYFVFLKTRTFLPIGSSPFNLITVLQFMTVDGGHINSSWWTSSSWGWSLWSAASPFSYLLSAAGSRLASLPDPGASLLGSAVFSPRSSTSWLLSRLPD